MGMGTGWGWASCPCLRLTCCGPAARRGLCGEGGAESNPLPLCCPPLLQVHKVEVELGLGPAADAFAARCRTEGGGGVEVVREVAG